ncbi:MAG: hypothetical protein LUH43_06735 [Clostridia bacterium]|nr:hypothetical protein [Clostridia bacterium]
MNDAVNEADLTKNEAEAEKIEKTKKSAPLPLKIISRALIVVLCVFGTGVLALLCVVMNIGSIISAETLNAVISDIDIAAINVGAFIADEDDGVTLSEYIFSSIDAGLADELGITEDDIIAVLNNEKIKEKISEIFTGVVEYVLSGDAAAIEIEAADVADFVIENEDAIEAALGREITDEQYRALEEYLEEYTDDGQEDETSDASSESDVSSRFSDAAVLFAASEGEDTEKSETVEYESLINAIKTLSAVLSPTALIIAEIIICALILLLSGLRAETVLLSLGIQLFASGGIIISVLSARGSFVSAFFEEGGAFYSTVMTLADNIFSAFAPQAIIYAVIGAAAIAGSVVIRILRKRMKKAVSCAAA